MDLRGARAGCWESTGARGAESRSCTVGERAAGAYREGEVEALADEAAARFDVGNVLWRCWSKCRSHSGWSWRWRGWLVKPGGHVYCWCRR